VKEDSPQAHPVLSSRSWTWEVVTPATTWEMSSATCRRAGKDRRMTQRAGAHVGRRECAALRDVRLLDHAPLDEPGPRDLQHAVQSLPGSAEIEGEEIVSKGKE